MLWTQNAPTAIAVGGGDAIIGCVQLEANAGELNEGAYSTFALVPEPSLRVPISRPGNLRRMEVNVGPNTLNGNFVISVGINGVATGLTVTYAATETGRKTLDLSTVTVVAGDGVSFILDATAPGAGNGEVAGSVEFVPSS